MSLYQYSESLPPDAKVRYASKLNLIGIESCPFKIPADRWINDPQKWPAVDYKDVYNYLIKSPRLYSSEAMENYRSLDAHNYFVSGWVHTVLHIEINGNFVLKADVKPSYRVTEEPHHPWVALRKDGPIIAAHCSCMAGLGETCSHVGALLFKMEAAVRLGYTLPACTEVSCQWNQCFVKNVQPDRIANIKFYKPESVKRLLSSTKKKLIQPSTEDEQYIFLNSLNSLEEKAVGLASFAGFSEHFLNRGPTPVSKHLPRSMRSVYSAQHRNLSKDDVTDLCSRTYKDLCSITIDEIEYVKEVTLLQSLSQSWHDVRLGRITSSVAADVLKTSPQNPSKSILKKICMPNSPLTNVPAVAWGKQCEADAYNLYSYLTGGSVTAPDILPTGIVYTKCNISHQKMSVKKSGFIIMQEKPFIGASPDGLLECVCCGVGVLEIKCPYKYKDVSINTDIQSNVIDYIDDKYNIKKKHKYYYQIQLQMYVSKADYADFFIRTPIDCVLTRVQKNDLFIAEIVEKIDLFWRVSVLPELLLRTIENDMSSNKENSGTILNIGRKKHCKCQTQTNFNNMVGCDRCDEWYHPKCLGLKRLPQTKTWYCLDCRN